MGMVGCRWLAKGLAASLAGTEAMRAAQSSKTAFRSTHKRRAIVMKPLWFWESSQSASSWFGRVELAAPGEAWPTTDGKPMHPICQINLTEFPFRPSRLEDIEVITIFIGPDGLPIDQSNGMNWCLRTYRKLHDLVHLLPIDTGSNIKPIALRPSVISEDYPCFEDVSPGFSGTLPRLYPLLFPNKAGFKFGGWPSLIQSEIDWATNDEHPIAPEYVFQIDSYRRANWYWGDNGVGYFGRGTRTSHLDDWAVTWQCY